MPAHISLRRERDVASFAVVATDRRLCRIIAAIAVGLIVAAACSDEAAIADLPPEVPPDHSTTTTTLPPGIDGPNVLLIIADDLGVDVSPCYAADAVSAPTIEALCRDGIVFDRAWSMPVCSPTRASIFTGRYGRRTGVGDVVQRADDALDESEFSLPRAVSEAGLPHATANFGKWHLGDDPIGPLTMGWDYFSGFLEGDILSYDSAQKVVNGDPRSIDDYVTTDQVNDAIDWISHRDRVPWLVWLALSAPHEPFHVPPAELHDFDALSGTIDDIDADPRPYYDAALQALDTEVGRLIASLEPEVLAQTTIIFIGDNGSPDALYPVELDEDGDEIPGRAKGTLYQGGIHIPFIVAGAGVSDGGRRSDALVHTVDLFATILELIGTNAGDVVPSSVTLDSVSLTPLLSNTGASVRNRLYAELFGETFGRRLNGATTRDDRYKVIRYEDGSVEAYDLVDDPFEEDDIFLAAGDDLALRLDGLLAEIDAVLPFELPTEEDADA
jgi:arylsulfatase A-like enzyme